MVTHVSEYSDCDIVYFDDGGIAVLTRTMVLML